MLLTTLILRISGFVNQIGIQLEILKKLVSYIKAGSYTGDLGVPKSTVLMGHSFGSILSHGLATTTPDAVDAIILTAYAVDPKYLNVPIIISAWQLKIASLAGKVYEGLDKAYVVWDDLKSNKYT